MRNTKWENEEKRKLKGKRATTFKCHISMKTNVTCVQRKRPEEFLKRLQRPKHYWFFHLALKWSRSVVNLITVLTTRKAIVLCSPLDYSHFAEYHQSKSIWYFTPRTNKNAFSTWAWNCFFDSVASNNNSLHTTRAKTMNKTTNYKTSHKI